MKPSPHASPLPDKHLLKNFELKENARCGLIHDSLTYLAREEKKFVGDLAFERLF